MKALAPWFALGRGATDGSIIAIKNVRVDNGDDVLLKSFQAAPWEIIGPEGSFLSTLSRTFKELDTALFDVCDDKQRTLKVMKLSKYCPLGDSWSVFTC